MQLGVRVITWITCGHCMHLIGSICRFEFNILEAITGLNSPVPSGLSIDKSTARSSKKFIQITVRLNLIQLLLAFQTRTKLKVRLTRQTFQRLACITIRQFFFCVRLFFSPVSPETAFHIDRLATTRIGWPPNTAPAMVALRFNSQLITDPQV